MNQSSRRILTIETSGRAGSVVLGAGIGYADAQIVESSTLPGTMRHASELMPTIDRLVKQQNWPADSITDVFVSIGPGSFTGLRIGVSVARALAWSIGAEIIAVPTVDALARNALEADPIPGHLAVVLDAKRKQIYTAAFDIANNRVTKTIDACLADPADFFARCPKPLAVLGEGVAYHREAIDAAGVLVLDEILWPARAQNIFYVGLELAADGKYTSGPDLMPLYIRRPEAEEKWEKLHGKK